MQDKPKKRHVKSYPLELKLKVIKYAKANNNYQAFRMYGIHESVVRRWRKLEKEYLAQEWRNRNKWSPKAQTFVKISPKKLRYFGSNKEWTYT